MKNDIMKTINQIKNYITIQRLTNDQLEDVFNWCIITADDHRNGIEVLDEKTVSELDALFEDLNCAYYCELYGYDIAEEEMFYLC